MSLKVKCENSCKGEKKINDQLMNIQSFIDLRLPIQTLATAIKFELMKNVSIIKESPSLNTYMCYIDALLNDFYYNGCINGDKYLSLAIMSNRGLDVENIVLDLLQEIFLCDFSYYSKKIND